MVGAAEALKIGLIDEVFDTEHLVNQRADFMIKVIRVI